MSDEILIRVENVSKKFARRLRHAMWYGVCDLGREVAGLAPRGERLRTNEFWALRDVTFELKRGECLGVIGANGAGKSTLLKLLNGIIRPTAGRIRVRGRVGALIEVGAGFHPMLTGRENVYVNGAILGMGKAEIDRKFDAIVDFADIGDFLDTPVKFYSSGMYVRLGFAIAAHLEPDILLIDEVLAVGDVAFQSRCLNAIGRLRQNGCTLLLISHNMHSIIRSATRVLYLRENRMRALGPMETVLECYRKECTSSPVVREAAQDTTANGTGAAVIEKVVFAGADGREVDEVESGQPVSVRVHYRRVVPSVKNPTLDLCICDQFGHMFYQSSNRIQDVQLGELNARGVLEARIETLCAAPQMLTFYLAMWNVDQTELLDWRRDIPLRVTGSPLSLGQVHLRIRWGHRDDA